MNSFERFKEQLDAAVSAPMGPLLNATIPFGVARVIFEYAEECAKSARTAYGSKKLRALLAEARKEIDA